MAIDNKARAIASQSCNKISVNGSNFVSSNGVITLPNYPNDGGGAFYTAGDNITIDVNNIISGDYQIATTLEGGLLSSEDKIKLDTIEDNANNYVLPTASDVVKGGLTVNGINTTIVGTELTIDNVTQSIDGFMSNEDKTKLEYESYICILPAIAENVVVHEFRQQKAQVKFAFRIGYKPHSAPIGYTFTCENLYREKIASDPLQDLLSNAINLQLESDDAQVTLSDTDIENMANSALKRIG